MVDVVTHLQSLRTGCNKVVAFDLQPTMINVVTYHRIALKLLTAIKRAIEIVAELQRAEPIVDFDIRENSVAFGTIIAALTTETSVRIYTHPLVAFLSNDLRENLLPHNLPACDIATLDALLTDPSSPFNQAMQQFDALTGAPNRPAATAMASPG